MDSVAIQLVKILPSILWLLLIVAILVLFYRPICDELLPNLANLKAMGVELSFVKDSMNAAIELAEKSPQWKVEVSSRDKELALSRARQHVKVFRNARILWVDDHPENNRNELRMFRQLQADIDIATSTEKALDMLRNDDYDLILSDMARDDKAMAGLEFLEQCRKESKSIPVIFYIGVLDPTKGVPPQAFGITNRPDELLHLTLDVLERKKS